MRTIWKYKLETHKAEIEIDMPKGAHVVHVATQGSQGWTPQIWALVDTEAPLVKRKFVVVGTGHEVPPSAYYVGTYFELDGAFVWHLYEVKQ